MATTALSKDEILTAIGNMSVMELAELIDAFKEKFNVTIAAPMAAAPAGGGAAAAPEAEEKTEFTVILKEAGAKKIQVIKAGKIEFRVDKTGNLHGPIGKISFSAGQLHDNLNAFVEAVMRAKPSAAKGTYLRSLTVSSTMGPGVPVDTAGYK